MVIGSNERSRRVNVPFDIFGQIWPSSGGEIGRNCRKKRFFFKNFVLLRAATFEQKILETWL